MDQPGQFPPPNVAVRQESGAPQDVCSVSERISDAGRLKALQQTALLDSPSEEAFDRLTRLARRVLGVPVALVSLVDDHRQFFKSAAGLPEPWASQRETPLSHSFCQHVVSQSTPLVVQDARANPLVQDNLAIRDLGVIAYAGVPLTLPGGQVLGAFAAVDFVPRHWSDDDLTILQDLAAAVITEAELRLTLKEARQQADAARAAEQLLRQSEFRVRVLLDIASDATTTFAQKLDYLLRTGCQQFGLPHAFLAESSGHILQSVTLAAGGTDADSNRLLRESLCQALTASGSLDPAFATAAGVSFVCSPILIAEGTSGCLCFYGALDPASDTRRVFSQMDQEFAHLLGQWVGSELRRSRFEDALNESRERYQLAVRGSRDGIWDWDIARNQVFYSPRWKAMLGYDPSEVRNETGAWEALLHPADRQQALGALDSYLAGRTPEYEVEYRMRHKDGSYCWVLARGIALRDADGAPHRMAGSHSDITRRKQAEAALRESEASLAEAQRVAQMGNWVLDLTKGTSQWSRQVFLLHGLDPTEPEPLHQAALERIHPEDRAQATEAMERCLETGDVQRLNYRIHPAGDGAIRYLYLILQPRRDEQGGRITHLSGTVMDVTSQKLEEAERSRLIEAAQDARARADESRAAAEIALSREKEQAALLQAQTVALACARDEALKHARTKSEFLANMSHEIRTPMNGVLGMTGLLMDTPLTLLQHDYAESIRSCASALLTVINDILDFSKIESGKLRLEEADFDLRSLVEETTATVAPAAHGKGLEITCRVTPMEVPLTLKGDSGRLRQVLTNLLGNAVKFTETGHVGITASVIWEDAQEALVRIAVSDTGIGIAENRREAIFESFIQADGSTTRRYGGTGLGLTISRQIIGLMGGQISVESEPEKGSTFLLELRFPKGEGQFAGETATPDALKGLRILAVDDNAVNRQVIGEQLSAWGCRVHLASSGAEGIALLSGETGGLSLASDPFDAILMDLQMPGMDGLQTATWVRQQASLKRTPVILLSSGFSDESDQNLETLFDAVLSKPVRRNALLGALLRVIASASEKATAPPLPLVPRKESAAPAKDGLSGVRILLAEDNLVNQKVATHLLKKWNSVVTVVGNGQAALDSALAAAKSPTPFDLVLMDVQMPEMDGMTATGRLRSLEVQSSDGSRRLPIIALTAHSMRGDRERCLAAGMDDYLSKPINEAELHAVLLRWSPTADTNQERKELPENSGLQNTDDEGRLVLRSDRLWECCGGDAELVREVAEEFLQSVPLVLGRMAAAISSGDAAGICFEAHTLRGSCRTVGAEALEAVCGMLEGQAAAGNLTNAVEWWDQVRAAEANLVPALKLVTRAAAATMETENPV